MRLKSCSTAVVLSLLAVSSAIAETSTAPGQPAVESGRSENLSKTLSKNDGVIKPSGDVDPGMKVPTPHPDLHPMPVIPPSATGGNSAK